MSVCGFFYRLHTLLDGCIFFAHGINKTCAGAFKWHNSHSYQHNATPWIISKAFCGLHWGEEAFAMWYSRNLFAWCKSVCRRLGPTRPRWWFVAGMQILSNYLLKVPSWCRDKTWQFPLGRPSQRAKHGEVPSGTWEGIFVHGCNYFSSRVPHW